MDQADRFSICRLLSTFIELCYDSAGWSSLDYRHPNREMMALTLSARPFWLAQSATLSTRCVSTEPKP